MKTVGETKQEEKGTVYWRMATGGIIGLVLSAVLGYAWAAHNDNLNPVAGLGLVVLSGLGLATGAVIGLFKKRKP